MNVFKYFLKFLYPIIPTSRLRSKILVQAGYVIGKDVYLPSTLLISDISSRRSNVIIGNRVSIGPRVTIITDSSPNNSKLIGLYPLKSENVTIGDDTWIGANSIILPGIEIGKFCVIGAGSVVTKNVLDYSVVVGNPARTIKSINHIKLGF